MRRVATLIRSLTLVLCTLLALGSGSAAWAQQKRPMLENPQDIDSVLTKTFSVEYGSSLERCTVTVSFPQIVDANGDPLDDTIDHPGKTAVNQLIIQTVEAEADRVTELCDYDSKLTRSYKIHFNRNGILSISLTTEIDETHSPYTMTLMESLNFDYHKGKRLFLPDILTGEYQPVLNDRVAAILRSMGFEDATPFIEHDTPFCLTASHIVFFIDIENPPVPVPVAHSFLADYMQRDINKPVERN